MSSSDHLIKILDDILLDRFDMTDKDAEKCLILLLQPFLSSLESSSTEEKKITPTKRKEPDSSDEVDTRKQQQQQPTCFETLGDAFKAVIQEFDGMDETDNLVVYVDGNEFTAETGESFGLFRSRLIESKSPKILFEIETKDGKSKYTFTSRDVLNKEKNIRLLEDIRETFGVGSIVDIINDECGPPKPLRGKTYIPGVVELNLKRMQTGNIEAFQTDPLKASAVVVSGESGSGKSTFVQNEFVFDRCATIYHSIDDCDVKMVEELQLSASKDQQKQQPQHFSIARRLAKVLLKLDENGFCSGDLYTCVSKLHYDLMSKRNKAAVDALDTILFSKYCKRDSRLTSWWKGKEPGVNKLVLVIDEAGRNLDFARGLVDSVREMHRDWRRNNRCELFKLVLAGSGLEESINADSLDIDDDDLSHELASFGTDPTKSNVIVLRGPSKRDLKEKLRIWISNSRDSAYHPEMAQAIPRGVYSRVLATNSRMLFDGVLPMLRNKELTYGFDGHRATQLQQRLIDLCSTNIVMDYAARNYVTLNGLSRVSLNNPRGQQSLLEGCFRYLLEASYSAVKEANQFAFADGEKGLDISPETKAKLVQMGLVASNPLETSPALRYLACEGHSVELIQSDGQSFEALVAAHLRRFEQVVRGFPTVHTHDLKEAWPPKSSKAFDTLDNVKDNLKKRFSEHAYTDVTTICNQLVKEKKKLAIVMKQRVPTAQSADIFVLESVWSESNETLSSLTLDLYQAKHYKEYPNDLKKWALSLGISMPNSAESPHLSAFHSNLGMKFFLSCLEKRLLRNHHVKVDDAKIRNRVLVVSGTKEQTKWEANQFQAAKESGLMIWTRENLEPTFSAITGGDDDLIVWESEGNDELKCLGQEELGEFFS